MHSYPELSHTFQYGRHFISEFIFYVLQPHLFCFIVIYKNSMHEYQASVCYQEQIL